MLQSEVVKITPEMAQQWLVDRPYGGQRTLRPYWVQYLADEMRRGNFVQGTPIRFEEVEGKLYLVDGRHRLNGVVSSGVPQMFCVLYGQAKNQREVAEIYGNLDINLRRTFGDLYSAMELPAELGFTGTQMNRMGAAATFIMGGFRRMQAGRVNRKDLVQYIRDYAEAGGMFFEATAGAGNDIRHRLDRAATLSVGLATFRYSCTIYGENPVIDFWKGVAFDDGVRANDPRKHANRHLLSATMPLGGTNGRSGRMSIVSPAYSSRYIANCFNAFVQEKEMTQGSKVYDATAPIKILGSPFK